MLIKKDKDMLASYFEDASGMKGSYADFAAIAQSEKDISDFLIDASQKKIPVTIAGALTANTGAGLSYGGAVLSLEKLNNIGEIEIHSDKKAFITVQAGARLIDISDKVFKEGWLYPPDPTEKNSLIGGNISTNASGGRGFKFGSTRQYIQSLKIIFSDGSIAQIKRGQYIADLNGQISFQTSSGIKQIVLPKYNLPKIKNAAGYYNYPNADLIDIFIGSEGTLGVISEAKLLLLPAYKELFGGIIFFDLPYGAFDFTLVVKNKIKNNDSYIKPMSLEYLDSNSINLIRPFYPQIPKDAKSAIMFEQDIYKEDDENLYIDKWIDFMRENQIDEDKVWFAQNIKEMQKFKELRHKIPETVNAIVKRNAIPKVGTDFAVPDNRLKDIYDFCETKFKESGIFYLIFGHIGESHFHANIVASNEEEFIKTRKLYEQIIKKVIEYGGTVSAEHGIGKLRHIFLKEMVGQSGLKEMAKFKKSLDKSYILCLDNIFPKEILDQS
ncbi:MAG: FAD-binding oxidoreductase [Elusimicrobiota bacterium]|jgi:D-lactate dehydrogenase (cytochrome)|nr:FAD-binding oxidoreductase [Elusimicrobiota bacterium]